MANGSAPPAWKHAPVYSFGAGEADGGAGERPLLGGKGAHLQEMSRLGIPVPPGFTITTEACRLFYQAPEHYPGAVRRAVDEALELLEGRRKRRFGDPHGALLVSVRSGAAVSMPGMMDTVLNVGMSNAVLEQLRSDGTGLRFPLDCYRRLIEMYGSVVRGVKDGRFQGALAAVKMDAGVERDHELSADQLQEVVHAYLEIFQDATGQPFPQDPREQLWGAIDAVFASWRSSRAVTYRRIHHIPAELGTAVTVQAMVFGNRGPTSASGVCFTRDPANGEPLLFGEFLPNAQGEDVVAGIRTPRPMRKDEGTDGESFEETFPDCYRQLLEHRARLERHFGDVQDIEFTVDDHELFLLQTRRAQRTGAAALRIACDLLDEGLVDEAGALRVVPASSLTQVMAPAFGAAELEAAAERRLARGLPASPGAATGRIALSAEAAVELCEAGHTPVLVREETCPEDIAGMHVAAGIVTTRGGKTSHAAVVARGLGKPCVVACAELSVDEAAGTLRAPGGRVLKAGDELSLDGSAGQLYRGTLTVQAPEVIQVLDGKLEAEASPLYQCFHRVMKLADGVRTLQVRANADTPEDARMARRLGAEGIGLCRTEHMFFGAGRILPFRRMILASSEEERRQRLDELRPLQRGDFVDIFRAMDGCPVTIRLLDPPLHEFLPHEAADVARFAREAGVDERVVTERLEKLYEQNPMLGLRGCRLGIVHPEIYEMQLQAILEATVEARADGVDARPEIMVPLVALASEVERLRETYERVRAAVPGGDSAEVAAIPFGTMIEVPRAALVAGQLAEQLDFFSFGTNDLTQMTLGLSRDDSARLVSVYVEEGLLPHDPFGSLDQEGVGQLMALAAERGRAANPDLKLGICGEHGGDPSSIAFCQRLGLDSVSCSPYRIPVARLAAAQAALQ